jgi:hypothetical protein
MFVLLFGGPSYRVWLKPDTTTRGIPCFGGLTLDETPEADERVIPLGRDFVEVTAGIVEAPRLQLPDAFAAALGAVHQTGVFHHPQVFRDGLTGYWKAFRQPGDGHRPTVAKASDEAQPRFVAERGKKRSGARKIRFGSNVSCSSQDISQSA